MAADTHFEHEVLIRETHLDIFGHVNNAVYLQLFEDARWDIISNRGYGIEKIQETGQGPTILEIRIQFLKEVRNRDKIVIKTWVLNQSKKITTMRQVMVNDKGEDACVADFVFGLFDLRARKLVEPTAAWKHAIGLS